MFRSDAPSMRRASACIFTTSTPVAPGRTPSTRRLAYIGASEWISESGTNSVKPPVSFRSEEHTSELQSQSNLVCRLLLEKKKKKKRISEDANIGKNQGPPGNADG